MKVLAALAALALVACGHLQRASELSEADAIGIARAEAARRHIPLKGLEPSVARFDTGVSISFDTPQCRKGGCLDAGLPLFFIPTGQRRVTYVRTTA